MHVLSSFSFRKWTQEAGIRARALLTAAEGIAAVEFAMLLPAFMMLYLGLVETTLGVTISRKLTLLSRSVADLAARSYAVNKSELGTIFDAASSIMDPYSTAELGIVVSSIAVTGSGNNLVGKVCWSEARNGSPRAAGSIYTIPDGYKTAGSTFIVAEAKRPYKPIFDYALTGTFNLSETTPWPVRNVAEVPYSGLTTYKDSEMGRSATGKCLS